MSAYRCSKCNINFPNVSFDTDIKKCLVCSRLVVFINDAVVDPHWMDAVMKQGGTISCFDYGLHPRGLWIEILRGSQGGLWIRKRDISEAYEKLIEGDIIRINGRFFEINGEYKGKWWIEQVSPTTQFKEIPLYEASA